VPVISSLIRVVVVGNCAVALAGLYLLPVFIGRVRRVPDIGAVAVVGILLGWTFLGWLAALAMALRPVAAAGPVLQDTHNLPPSPPPSGPACGAGWAGPPGPPTYRPGSPPPLVLSSHAACLGGQGKNR
jgi:hypothetical protein